MADRPRRATIGYFSRVDESGCGVGQIPHLDMKYTIHRYNDLNDYKFAFKINHPNYLSCRFYDPEDKFLMYDESSSSLSHHLNQLAQRKVPVLPVVKYEPPKCLKLIQGRKPSHVVVAGRKPTYYYVPNEYREFVRGVLSFISYLHLNNHSLNEEGPLSLDEHFRVQGSMLKVWKVRFVKKSDDSIKNDYKLVGGVIRNLLQFPTYQGRMPNDMVALLDRLETFKTKIFSSSDDQILVHHLAVLSPPERIHRIRSYYEFTNTMYDFTSTSYGLAVKSVSPQVSGWTTRFPQESNYEPINDCFHHPNAPNFSIHYGDMQYSSDFVKGCGYLRFCRNICVHFMENIDKNHRSNFNIQHLDCLISQFGGDPLLRFENSVAFAYMKRLMAMQ